MADPDSSWLLFAGSSHSQLAHELSKALGVTLGGLSIETFPDGEIGVQVLEHVRGKNVFLLQSLARRPNHYLMELLILVDALKRASARSIVAVLPYYCYARQDRKEKGRVPITAKLVANLLEKAGVTRVLTLDLHTEQIQGFFDIPVDNLYARPLFARAIQKLGLNDLVVVSPDIGSNRIARKLAEDLKVELAIIDKRRLSSKKVEFNALIGDVSGKPVVLVDDICSTGGTLKTAAAVCRREGAKQIFAFVSHGLFNEADLEDSEIDLIYVTNSVPQEEGAPGRTVLSIAGLLGKAIERLISAESISSLFVS